MRAFLLTFMLFATARAEILDRVVAVVNSANIRHIITLSDLQKERETQRVIGRNLGTDHEVLQFVIERYLAEDQMQLAGVEVEEAEIDASLAEIRDYRGVPRADVRNALTRELKAEKYYESRFVIRPTDQELHDYYDKTIAAAAREQGVQVPTFEQFMQSADAQLLVSKVIKDKRSHQIEEWLDSLKKRERSAIETFE